MMMGNPVSARLYDANGSEVGVIAIDGVTYKRTMMGADELDIRARLYEAAALGEVTVEQWVNPATGEVEERTQAVVDATRCNAIGHQFEKAAVVYRDGMAVTHCSVCQVRQSHGAQAP